MWTLTKILRYNFIGSSSNVQIKSEEDSSKTSSKVKNVEDGSKTSSKVKNEEENVKISSKVKKIKEGNNTLKTLGIL